MSEHGEREQEPEGEGEFEPEALGWQQLDPDGFLNNVNWRLGIEELERLPFGGTGLWRQVGPAPLHVTGDQIFQGIGPNAGQVVDIAIDPTGADAPTIYIATNSGGVWKSTDGGVRWTPLTDFLPSSSVGAIAIDPGDSNVLYAGTGNLFEGGGGIAKGLGLYKSIDGGLTWAPMDGGPNATVFADNGINRIICPAPNVVLVGSQTGLFLSMNGGVSFGANLPNCDDAQPLRAGFVSALAMDTGFTPSRRVEDATPANPIVVTCRRHGFQNGDRVFIGGVSSNRNANGAWLIDRVDDDHFSLRGSMGSGLGALTGMLTGPAHPSTLNVQGATNPAAPNPIVIQCNAHGFVTGDIVAIHGVQGNTNANRSWEIRVRDADHFELVGSRGNAAYTGGGIIDGPRHAPPQAITAAANVAGGVELTAANHGLVDGDRVSLNGLPGIGAPTNSGTVRRIDDNRFRVAGVTMNAAYGGAGGTVAGPAAAWNTAYFAISGRDAGGAAHAPGGLFRLTFTSDGAFVLSDNLLSHTGGVPGNFRSIVFAQSVLPRPHTLYAGVQDGRGATARLVGVFRSDNYGRTWDGSPGTAFTTRLAADGANITDYAFTIGVDPQDSRRLYIGSQQAWRSTDGGATWPLMTPATGGGDSAAAIATIGRAPSTCSLHWDHHELVFPPCTHWRWIGDILATPTSVYFGTDGGITRSDDGITSFISLNEGIGGTALLKHMDIGRGAANNSVIFGGMQDTGTAGRRAGDPEGRWAQGIDGDGDIVAVDPFDPNIVYGFDNGNLLKTNNGGRTWFMTGFAPRPIITEIRNTNPIEIVTTGHPFVTGDTVTVTGVRIGGSTAAAAVANGASTVTRVDDRVLRLNGKNGTTVAAFDPPPRVTGGRYLRGLNITAATLAAPIEVETAQPHGLANGDQVRVEAVQGNTAANNTVANPAWTITVINATRFSLNGSDGSLSRPYVRGTGRVLGPRRVETVPILLATNANPIVVTALEHGFVTGEQVTVEGVRGNTNANGINQQITVIDTNSFQLDGVAGNGAFTAGPAVTGQSVGRGLAAGNLGDRRRISLVPNGGAPATRIYVSIRRQLFRSNNGGVTFTLVHTFPDDISALLSPTNNQLWVGLFSRTRSGGTPARPGEIHFSPDGGTTWFNQATNNFVSRIGARGAITGIAVDPRNPQRVAVVASGYSETDPRRRTRHCFLSTTAGVSVGGAAAWTEVGGVFNAPTGNLPDLPLLSVAFDNTPNPSDLLVASDGGVLRLGAANVWHRVGPNLPTVSCQALQVDSSVAPAVLRVGTYGRSAWELVRPAGPRVVVRAQLGFGERRVGQASRLPITVHNVGGAALTVTSLEATFGDFAFQPAPALPLVLAAGATQAFELEFNPTTTGPRSALFTLTSDDPETPFVQIKASGFGVNAGQPRLAVRPRVGFGTVRVGDTVRVPLEIRNTGHAPLNIAGLDLQVGGSATLTIPTVPALPAAIAPGQAILVEIQFAPVANGQAARTLTVRSDAGNRVVNLAGEGTNNAANLLAVVLQFFGLAEEPDEALV